MPASQSAASKVLSGEEFEFLQIYIRDHDGASSGGLHLAERCLESNKTTPIAPALQSLVATLTDAQTALRSLAEHLGIERSLIREATTWVGAALDSLKLNGRLTTYSPLSRVVELEALSSAVAAQLRLWETLMAIAPLDTRLDAAEAERRIGDCKRLLADLGTMHDSAVAEAFTPTKDPLFFTEHPTGDAQAAANASDEPPA